MQTQSLLSCKKEPPLGPHTEVTENRPQLSDECFKQKF